MKHIVMGGPIRFPQMPEQPSLAESAVGVMFCCTCHALVNWTTATCVDEHTWHQLVRVRQP
jgi:hypothetical protein